MMQSLLPTRERLARHGKVQSSACTFCQEDNMVHLLSCTQGLEVTAPLTRCLAEHVDTITPQNLVLPNFSTTESMELPVTWLLSTYLMIVWDDRVTGRAARLTTCQAELQARLIVLKTTKWKKYSLHNSAVLCCWKICWICTSVNFVKYLKYRSESKIVWIRFNQILDNV